TDAHDQQTSAASSAGFIVRLDAFTTGAVGLGEVGPHRGHDDAIAQLELADGGRLQQMGVAHGSNLGTGAARPRYDSFGQEVDAFPIEQGGMLDLDPVAAAVEHDETGM